MGDEAYWSKDDTVRCLAAGRSWLGLTQAELAKRLEVSEATVRRHEQGDNIPDDPHGRAKLLEDLWELGCPKHVLGLPEDYSLRGVDRDAVREMREAAEAIEQVERERRARGDGEPD